MNRKRVLAMLAAGMLVVVAGAVWYQTQTVSAKSTKIRRTILLSLKPEATEAQIQEMMKDVRKNIAPMKGVHGLYIGKQTNPKAAGYQYGISMDFDDEAALKAYRTNEEHRQNHNKYIDLITGSQITDIRDEY